MDRSAWSPRTVPIGGPTCSLAATKTEAYAVRIMAGNWVPIDDTSCWIYNYTWNPERPLTNAERERFAAGSGIHAQTDADYIPIRRRENDYLIDRAKQKTESYTGIEGVSEQDACIQDSQGPIADRTMEHLGPTDMGIIRFRRLILESARALMNGHPPAALADPAAYRVRGGGAVTPAEEPFAEVMQGRFGHEHGLSVSTGRSHAN